MKFIPGMLLAVCLVVGSANAAIITHTQNIPNNTPGSTYNLVFDKFDTADGELESVQIIFNLYTYGGSVSVDNDSMDPQTVTTQISLIGGLTSANVSLMNGAGMGPWATVNSSITQEFDLEATSGDDIGEYNNTGEDDWAVFNGPTSENANLQTRDDFVNSAYLGGYEGTGTYTIDSTTTQTSTASGTGQYAVTMMQTYGDITVTYSYTPIPEPATASLAGIGLLMLIRRRRRS